MDVTLTTLFCIVLVLWYIWRKQHLAYFKKLGIPGPEPGFLFGNILELYDKGPITCYEEWAKKYGKVFGFFYGMKPVLLVEDAELLKNIFIKDFQKFTNRESFNPIYEYRPEDREAQSVLLLPGQKWKEVRSVLTPTFTAAKIKQMAGSMNSSIDTMINVLKERAETGNVFDILDTYQRVTMDVITRTAFGVRTDIQTNLKSPLLRATKLLFKTIYRDPIIFVGLCFPYLSWTCRRLQSLVLTILNRGRKPDKMLKKGIKEVLRHRRQNPQGAKGDLLQLMLDTQIRTNPKEVDTKHLEIGDAETEAKLIEDEDENQAYRKMNDDEIIASSFTVLLAGYETTSTALAFTTYLLAKYPEVQEKLYQEILDLVQSGEKLEYGTLNKLQFLDQVFCESMRVYPPVYSFSNRYAVEDVQYGNLEIPKGTLIQAPVYLLHHDSEYWTEPEKFDPQRFSSKPNANGITYMPFGVGPRNCLGMRLAQIEAKLVLAHLIYNFKVTPSDSQREHLDIVLRIRTLAPKGGIQVKVELRDQTTN